MKRQTIINITGGLCMLFSAGLAIASIDGWGYFLAAGFFLIVSENL